MKALLRVIAASISVMACVAATASAQSTPPGPSAQGKLPRTIVPQRYTIELHPDLKNLSIAGSETIAIKVLQPGNQIVLNARDIVIDSVALDGGKAGAASIDAKAQTATLTFPDSFAAGDHKLSLSFKSRINQFSQGLFYVEYPTAGGRKRMIATQLEPTDARRIFPCWDEPAFKASFESTVTIPANFTAVSNMPIAQEQPAADGAKRVSFQATPPMSSYLFVLAAGELERISDDSDGIKVGLAAPAGKVEQGRYALGVAKQLLHYYDDYFGIKYPLPKLDLIAVPGGFGGAMENWGGITFFEGALLYDPASSPQSLERRIFSIVAHEMAHQWFGDLVTMGWWSDLWLNEGFADWMQARVEDEMHPDWDVWVNDGSRQGAMYADARSMTHPIQQTIADESEAEIAFDQITYEKGAAIIRLIENYVGRDRFREGIRKYISRHAYGNANTADLWSALEGASRRPVASIARPYTEQPGMPLIMADEKCREGERVISVRQQRFNIHYPEAKPELWQIPIAWGAAGANKAGGDILLREKTGELKAQGCEAPIKLNFGDVGYYRVRYDPETLSALTGLIETMQPADRVSLLADYWALLEARQAGPADYFNLVEASINDHERAVWRQIIGPLLQIDDLERGLPGRVSFQAYARSKLRPAFDRLGWDAAPGESVDIAMLRASLLSALGSLGDADVAAEAKRRFTLFLAKRDSLDVNLRDAVVSIVGRNADQQTYDALRGLGREATNSRDRMRYYAAMARASDPELIEKTLQIALTDEIPAERSNELILIVASGEHPELALKFVLKHFDELAAQRSPEFRHLFMSRLMSNFADRAHAEQLADFAPVHETSGGRIEALRAEARIIEAADFRGNQLPEIDAWVRGHAVASRN